MLKTEKEEEEYEKAPITRAIKDMKIKKAAGEVGILI